MKRYKLTAQKAGLDISAEQKVDEIPYDFVRKRLSVVAANAKGERTLITKGAPDNILSICKGAWVFERYFIVCIRDIDSCFRVRW
jgi:magnesium-transporting ATPase (P-type)